MNRESTKAGKTPEPGDPDLEAALRRGVTDVEAGRVHPVDHVRSMIPQWIANVRKELPA